MNSVYPFAILIVAPGGDGSAVIAEWLVAAAAHEGYPAQCATLPGLPQRNGSASYYVEIFPSLSAASLPVLSLLPSPGEVDVLLAAELLEAGRAMQAGYVTPERSTLIAATHRIYTLTEKLAVGDGRYDAEKILAAAPKLAKRALLRDFAQVAQDRGVPQAAVLFGALAAAGVLPLSREACVAALNEADELRGFELGYAAAAAENAAPQADATPFTMVTNPLAERIARDFPAELAQTLDLATRRLIDYQDADYATLYLDRLRAVLAVDREAEGEQDSYTLTRETGRLLALWMAYEDVMRIADLKSRPERYTRLRREAGAQSEQPIIVVDYLKPGIEYLADVLSPAWAKRLRDWETRRGKPWRVALKLKSNSVLGYLALRLLARLKSRRRGSARYAEEQALIERWLGAVKRMGFASMDRHLALEIALCAKLVRGYGETRRCGRENFVKIFDGLVENESMMGRGIEGLKQAVRSARTNALGSRNGAAAAAADGRAGGTAKPIIWISKQKEEGAASAAPGCSSKH